MMMKHSAFILLFLSATNAFSLATPVLSTGHREAMMANGGSTQLCSSGQFALNPAGLFCSAQAGPSESFGSAGFYATSISTEQGGAREMGGGFRTTAGLSLFSQGVFTDDMAYGAWALINPTAFARSFLMNDPNGKGTYESNTSQTDTSVGPFVSVKSKDFHWGATLVFLQTESKSQGFRKVAAPTETVTYNFTSSSTEQSVASRLGAIWGEDKFQYSVVVLTPNYSLKGLTRSDTTRISTNNGYNENFSKGTIRTFDTGSILLGMHWASSDLQVWGGDVTLVGRTRAEIEDSSLNDTIPASFSMGLNSERVFTEKISVLSGLRFNRSFEEDNQRYFFQSAIASVGVLRKYKGVQLGSGFGYTRFISENRATATQSDSSYTTLERLDLTFSSTFTY
jgi:hypothetical protein